MGGKSHMKILIVDDELLVRIGVKSSIDWAKHGMEIVGEASNGQEALEKIRKNKPDVLILDIKMPVMDGIELLQKVKEEKLSCKSIILSSFDDLEHVKEAMKLGAVDYLHKPCMSPEGMIRILNQIKTELYNERQSLPGGFVTESENREDQASSYLKKLVDGQLTEDDFHNGLTDYKISLGRSNYSCIAFSIIHFNKVQQRYTDMNRSLLNKSILDILNQVFLNNKEIVFFQYSKNLYLALVSMEKITSQKEIFELLNRYVHLLADSLKKFLDIELSVGISDTHASPKGIKNAFIESFKALQQRFYFPSEKVVYYGTLTHKQGDKALMAQVSQLVNKLKECISSQSFYPYKSIIEEIFSLLRKTPVLSSEEVIKLFNGILFLLNELDTCFAEMNLVSAAETLDELHSLFEDILNRKLCNCLEEDQYKNCSFLVKKILNYVNGHYEKELSLTLLSEELNISPNYISRVFREEVGKTLFNYINEVRVEQAKRLMHQQELKIYEIGEKVGFNSSVHFNIVFNKLTGCSPKQYRDTLMD